MISSPTITESKKGLTEWSPDFELHLMEKGHSAQRRHAMDEENPMRRLATKWKGLRQSVKRAGHRQDKLSWRQRIKGQLWDYPKGQIIGFFKGVKTAALMLINPKSILHKFSLQTLPQDLPYLGETVLDYGTEFAEADWERRGEMSGEAIAPSGLMILMASKGLPNSASKIFKGIIK